MNKKRDHFMNYGIDMLLILTFLKLPISSPGMIVQVGTITLQKTFALKIIGIGIYFLPRGRYHIAHPNKFRFVIEHPILNGYG